MLKHLTGLSIACLLPLSPSPFDGGNQQPAIGSKAPTFACTDWKGEELSLEDLGSRALLIFFHADRLKYSNEALDEVVRSLAGAAGVRKRTTVILVSTGSTRLEEVCRSMEKAGVDVRVALDPDREHFAPYRVIAFPTAFCVAPDRTIVEVVKGYGPLMAFRVVNGCSRAAGLIDEEGFRRTRSGTDGPGPSPEVLKLGRTLRLATKLAASGNIGEATAALRRLGGGVEASATGVKLLVRLLILGGRVEEAEDWLTRLTPSPGGDPEPSLLRARIHLIRKDPDSARRELERVPLRVPEARLLRGMLLEAEGRWRDAAEFHRDTIEAILLRDLGAQIETSRAPTGTFPADDEQSPLKRRD